MPRSPVVVQKCIKFYLKPKNGSKYVYGSKMILAVTAYFFRSGLFNRDDPENDRLVTFNTIQFFSILVYLSHFLFILKND